jgi:LysR family transcriptional activator of dmlA
VQLRLSVNQPPLTDDAYDVGIRFGEPPDARVFARRLAPNRRLLCASPAYLKRRGTPLQPKDLLRHDCIGIRQGDEAYGTWRLTTGTGARARTETVKVRGSLATNDGGIAVSWALPRAPFSPCCREPALARTPRAAGARAASAPPATTRDRARAPSASRRR